MSLYDIALVTYESAGNPGRHAVRRNLLRNEIESGSLSELLRCLERIECDDSDDAEEIQRALSEELSLIRARVRRLILH